VAHQVGAPKVEERSEPPAKPETPAPEKRGSQSRAAVTVEGVDDVMTHMAQCCKPLPYDELAGFVTRGRGVTVHRRDCANLVKMPEQEKARLVDVRWANQPAEAAYPVDLLVIASDRKGLLRDISSVLSEENIDVLGVYTASDRTKDRATMRFTVEVKDVSQLEKVLMKLGQIPEVLDVRRSH